MLKSYRRRFVMLNMLLVGVALLLALIAQWIYLYRSSYAEMKSTMQMLVEPWDEPGARFRMLGEDKLPGRPEGPPKDEDFPPPEMTDLRQKAGEGIYSVFYSAEKDEIAVLSRESALTESELASAVREIAQKPDSFGKLADYRLYYYRDGSAEGYKIALADTGYLSAKVLRNGLMLLLAYVAAMVLVFFISRWLSKIAARPMEDAVKMERQFVADISHDLKTPITVVLANNSILRTNPDFTAQERAQWIDSTDEAARNMMKLVGEMLTLSSLEAVGKAVELQPVCLSSVAEKASLQLESLAYERGVTVDTEIAGDVYVRATPEYAEKICSGLLENAMKYEPDGGRVLLTITAAKKKAVLTVRNFGSVIAEEDRAHIFERFYRGDKARTERSGFGLGLPILKQVTELLGAEITAQSSEAEGTVFIVTFETCEG